MKLRLLLWLVNIKIRCWNIPLWKIINEQGGPKKHYSRIYHGMTRSQLNTRQAFQLQNQPVSFHTTFSTNSQSAQRHKGHIFLFSQMTHVFTSHKLEVIQWYWVLYCVSLIIRMASSSNQILHSCLNKVNALKIQRGSPKVHCNSIFYLVLKIQIRLC
jgi:hypothetical protein